MNCEQARLLIDPYADGELEAVAILELEKHLKECPACRAAWHHREGLKQAVKRDAPYFTAPAALRQRIKAELPAPEAAPLQRPVWNWNWLTGALAGTAAVCLALLLMLALTRPTPERQLAREIVSGHIRSLMANHVMDVVSTDQHTVKPWFHGKLDFSPPVRNLADRDFPLVGGRLDYLNGRAVAALVFQRHNHPINLFVWPAPAADTKPAATRPSQGYNLIHWSEAGMIFWAVSDLNETELMEFARNFAAGQAPGP